MTDTSTYLSQEELQLQLLKGKRKRVRQRAFFIGTMIIIPIIQFLVFYVYINLSTFPLAFQRKNPFVVNEVEWVGLKNFQKVFELLESDSFTGDTGLLTKAIINSISYFVLNTFIMSPVTVILGYFFWRKMPGYQVFRFTFMLPSLIPGMVLPMLYAFMLDPQIGVLTPLLRNIGLGSLVPENGWLGTYETAQGCLLFYGIWTGSGLGIVSQVAQINRIPPDVFESARLDGIKLMQELWFIVVPMIMPMISIGIVMGISTILSTYMLPMLITKGGPVSTTKTIGYLIMDWSTQGEEGVGAAAGLLFSFITIPIVFLTKYGLERITPEVTF